MTNPAPKESTARVLPFPIARLRSSSTRRNLRHNVSASLSDGTGFSFMVGLGETYLPPFLLALGMGEVSAGLIAAVPLMAGAVFQLISPFMVQWLGSYRKWVVACATVQCCTFLPLTVAAIVGYLPLPLAFLLAATYWAMGLGAGPAWNGWMGRIISPLVRTRFFAKRSSITQMGTLGGFITGGLLLHFASPGNKVSMFAIVFFSAFAARLYSVICLSRQTEDPDILVDYKPPSAKSLAKVLSKKPPGHLLSYVFFLQFSVYLSAPYFTPFLLSEMKVGYLGFVVLTAISFVAKILALPMMADYAKKHGTRALMWVAGIGVIALPVLWLLSTNFIYFIFVQFITGVFWSAFDLAFPLLILETIPEKERINVLTFHNFCQSTVIFIAALIGAAFLDGLGRNYTAYAAIFILSSLLRMTALLFLRNLSPPALPAFISLRTIAVRPYLGAIVEPIVELLTKPITIRPKKSEKKPPTKTDH